MTDRTKGTPRTARQTKQAHARRAIGGQAGKDAPNGAKATQGRAAQAAGPLVMKWAFAWRPDGVAEAMDDKIKLVQRAAKEADRLAASGGIAGWKSRKDRQNLVKHVGRALAPIEYRPGGKRIAAHWSVTSFLSPSLPASERAGLPSFETERAMLLGYWFAVPQLGGQDDGKGFAVLAQRLADAENTLIVVKQRLAPEDARGAHRPETAEVKARRKLIETAKGLGVGVRELTREIAERKILFGEAPSFRAEPVWEKLPVGRKPGELPIHYAGEPLDEEGEPLEEKEIADVWENRFHSGASKARKNSRKP